MIQQFLNAIGQCWPARPPCERSANLRLVCTISATTRPSRQFEVLWLHEATKNGQRKGNWGRIPETDRNVMVNFWAIGRLLQIGKTGYQNYSSETTVTFGGLPQPPPPMDPPLLATVVTFRSLCERTTGCVCSSSVSNSSAAQSNSSSWTQ